MLNKRAKVCIYTVEWTIVSDFNQGQFELWWPEILAHLQTKMMQVQFFLRLFARSCSQRKLQLLSVLFLFPFSIFDSSQISYEPWRRINSSPAIFRSEVSILSIWTTTLDSIYVMFGLGRKWEKAKVRKLISHFWCLFETGKRKLEFFFSFSLFLLHLPFTLSFFHLQSSTINFVVM